MAPLEFGLLGEHLGHSFSPAIHQKLAGYDYRLVELSPEQVGPFLEAGEFRGLNVTIPYKKTVVPFCRELSPAAARIGSVTARFPGRVTLRNAFGGSRVLAKLAGAQLPRIC